MGFDPGGLAPDNEDGECFDTNISEWMPLAEYVLVTCEDLIPGGGGRILVQQRWTPP